MIIYVTKKTLERYKLKLPEELPPCEKRIAEIVIENEKDNKILEWGAKLFYFDKHKCIQLVNFASKLTLFLFDIKKKDLENLNEIIAYYLLDLYKNDNIMINALKTMVTDHRIISYAKLTDRSIISTLNTTQREFADDGYRFYDFISNNLLMTREINRQVNFDWLFTMKENGKTEYGYAGERFRKLVLERTVRQ